MASREMIERAHEAYAAFGQTGDLRAQRLSDAHMQAALDAALTLSEDVAGCEWCVDGLQADGETPCPCQTEDLPRQIRGLKRAIAERDEQVTSLSAKVAEVERERDESRETTAAWKAEVDRVQNAHRAGARLDEGMTITDVIAWLKDHCWTHSDWASWFEQHPDDPRAVKGGVGTAEFHRGVEARYNSMIECLAANSGRAERLEKAVNRAIDILHNNLGRQDEKVRDVEPLLRAALQREGESDDVR